MGKAEVYLFVLTDYGFEEEWESVVEKWARILGITHSKYYHNFQIS